MIEFDCKLRCSNGYWTIESPFGQIDLGDCMNDMIDMNPELTMVNAIENNDEEQIKEIKQNYPSDYNKYKKYLKLAEEPPKTKGYICPASFVGKAPSTREQVGKEINKDYLDEREGEQDG